MPRLFHVSEDGPFTTMSPRPAPPGTPYEGRAYVWAVDDEHLPNYLLPRDCPRVCWPTPAGRVVAIEAGWAARLFGAALNVHELDPAGFELLDPTAGYWVCEHDVTVRTVRRVDDCVAALAERGGELRVTASLWPYRDAVVEAGGDFSVIRMRNARPR